METDAHYFRVGLYIIVISLAAAIFAIWVMSNGIKDSQEYRIYFEESVSGLSVGSPVKYRGVSVGQVKSIAIDKKDPRLIKVNVELSGDTPVKTDTIAGLKLQGITGSIYIELSGSTMSAQNLTDAQPDVRIPTIASETSSITTIMSQLPQIMEKLTVFTDQLAKLTTDENIAKLDETLGNINAITADMRDVMRDTKGNIIDSTEQLSGTMTSLKRAARDVNDLTDRVSDNPSSLIFPPAEQGIPAP